MGQQCAANSKRLKWAGLVPLREPREAIAALEEMLRLGALASVVFGTAGEKMLTDDSFTVFWDEFARRNFPLCVHMAASFPPFDKMVETFLDAHALSMALPAQMAFVALVGRGMLDRYPDMRIAFMEFGAEWIFYMVSRMDHYSDRDKFFQPPALSAKMPRRSIQEYLKSGRIFLCGEMDDPLMKEEIATVYLNWLLTEEGQRTVAEGMSSPPIRKGVAVKGIDPMKIAKTGEKAFLTDEEFYHVQGKAMGLAKEIFAALRQ